MFDLFRRMISCQCLIPSKVKVQKMNVRSGNFCIGSIIRIAATSENYFAITTIQRDESSMVWLTSPNAVGVVVTFT